MVQPQQGHQQELEEENQQIRPDTESALVLTTKSDQVSEENQKENKPYGRPIPQHGPPHRVTWLNSLPLPSLGSVVGETGG